MSALHKGYMAACIHSFIIGFSFMFIKIALDSTRPLDLLAFRFLVAFVLATIILLPNKELLQLNRREIIKILPLALFYPCMFFLFQTLGLLHLPSSEAGIIQATGPIFTLILSALLLRERAHSLQKVFVLVSVSGVIFVSLMKGAQIENYQFGGIILILLSTLSMSLYSITARRMTKHYPVFALTYLMTLMGFIFFTALSLGTHAWEGSWAQLAAPLHNPTLLAAVIYLGGLSSLASAFLSNYALSKLEAYKMSVFGNLATVITILAGAVFLHETLAWYHLLGALAILIGVAGTNFSGRSKDLESPPLPFTPADDGNEK